MNHIVEEMKLYVGSVDDPKAIAHIGVKRRSGRYPWGSGERPYQRSEDFLARVEQLKAEGMTEKDLMEYFKITSTDLRRQIRVAKHERRDLEVARAKSLREDGLSLAEIAQKMGYANDSSIRSLLNESTAINKNRAYVTADILEKELQTKNMLDVGAGVEQELGVTKGVLDEALFIMNTRGYDIYPVGMSQVTNNKQQTIMTVLAKEG